MSQGSAPIGLQAPKSKPGIAAQFFARLMEMCCSHQFSWPHTGARGQDYQVCVVCGATYLYDWTTMRRTRRLITPLEVARD
jgi:hypothetical protein